MTKWSKITNPEIQLKKHKFFYLIKENKDSEVQVRHTEGKNSNNLAQNAAHFAQLEERMLQLEEKFGSLEQKIDLGFKDLINIAKKGAKGGKFRGLRHSILK